MNITDTKRAVMAYMEADIPAYLWGAPGIGKSDCVKQLAKEIDYPIIDLRLNLLDPVDLRGLPMIDIANKLAVWCTPEMLPDEERHGPNGFLFMDEMNTSTQAMMAAAMGYILTGELGSHKKPDGWYIIAAGNDLSHKAAANSMPSAVANRFGHLEVDTDINDFSKWANSVDLNPEIVAFLRFRPQCLMTSDFQKNMKAFPTPRSWERVARIVDQKDESLRFLLAKGLVGEAAAAELEGFLRIYQNLPSLDSVLAAPQRAPVPSEISAQYAIATGLARKVDKTTFANAITYAERLPKDLEVMFVMDATNRTQALTHTKAYTGWAEKNHSALF